MYHIEFHTHFSVLTGRYELLPGLHFETKKSAKQFITREFKKVQGILEREYPDIIFSLHQNNENYSVIRNGKASCRWDIVDDPADPVPYDTGVPSEEFVVLMDGAGVSTLLLVNNWDMRFYDVASQVITDWGKTNSDFDCALDNIRERGYAFTVLDHMDISY